METNDSNIKPQQTGGLKLMTVFVVVLALHVVVIGGMTAYYLMRGSPDAEMLGDQTHKAVKMAQDGALPGDTPAPDATASTDKTAATTPADSTTSAPAPMTVPAPAADQVTSTETPANPPEPTVAKSTTPKSTTSASTTSDTPSATDTAPAPSVASTPVVKTPEVQSDTINGVPYVVKPRDSLARIAHLNHTSVAKLKAANNLTSDMLHIGQKLIVPSKTAQVAFTPAAAPANDSNRTTILSDTTTPSTTSPTGPIAKSTPTQATTTASTIAGKHIYTVVKGDTLTKIAHKFKTTPTAIMTANNLTDPTKLSIGKKLKIPSQEARSATTNEPVAPQQPTELQPKPTTAQLAAVAQ